MTRSHAAPLLDRLNAEQRAAATETDRPALVLSGAGTGKTTLLIARVGVCLDRGYAPGEIAISTFRSNLAREFRLRAQRAFGLRIARSLLMGTCHSLMGRLLRSRPDVAGLTEHYDVADEAASRRTILEACERGPRTLVNPADRKQVARLGKWLGRVKAAGVAPEEAEGWVDALLHAKAIARGLEGEAGGRSDGVDPDLQRLAAMWPDLADPELPYLRAAAAIYPGYQQLLRDRDLADFDDMILWPVLAMRRDAGVLKEFQGWASTWLVDEYQDSSALQVEALRPAGAALPEAGRHRGRRSEHLRVFRRHHRGHPRISRALAGCAGVPADAQLSLQPDCPRCRERADRAQCRPLRQAAGERGETQARREHRGCCRR